MRGQITPSSLIQLGLVCTQTQRETLPHVFQFESHPLLYGSKPPTKTHETLSSMELPDDMTYCLWLRCWTVSGNSGLSLTSDQSKELRSMEESKHSTSPRSSFVAPHREITLVIGLFFFLLIRRRSNSGCCSSYFIVIRPNKNGITLCRI